MSYDMLQYQTNEVAQTSAGAVTDYYTDGISVGPQPGNMAFILTVSDPGGGFAGNFDAIVQTAVAGALDSDPDSWIDTNTRINFISAVGTYDIQLTDVCLDKLRLHLENLGNLDAAIQVRWLSDTDGSQPL